MNKRKLIPVALALSMVLWAASGPDHCIVAAPASEPAVSARRPAKEELTPGTWAKFQALIRPHDNEWRHLRVHWLTDIVAARKKAAAEDKPIIVLRTGGAGYNDPLGAC